MISFRHLFVWFSKGNHKKNGKAMIDLFIATTCNNYFCGMLRFILFWGMLSFESSHMFAIFKYIQYYLVWGLMSTLISPKRLFNWDGTIKKYQMKWLLEEYLPNFHKPWFIHGLTLYKCIILSHHIPWISRLMLTIIIKSIFKNSV